MSSIASRVTDSFERMGQQAAEHDFGRRIRRVHHSGTWRSWADEVQDFVFEQPVRTLLFGIGVGLLIGAALVRR